MSSDDRGSEHGQAAPRASVGGKYLTFNLAAEEYGIEILKVREIIGVQDVTRIPKTDACIRGVINLRGRVIPVVDLRRKFGMDAAEATEQTVVIVVQFWREARELTMGVLVDSVLEVLNIAADQIEPTPDIGSGAVHTDFILGVGKADRRVIFLLDIGKVLSAAETKQVAENGSRAECAAETGKDAGSC
jgi:purine-binding chemotaxis protein CheW